MPAAGPLRFSRRSLAALAGVISGGIASSCTSTPPDRGNAGSPTSFYTPQDDHPDRFAHGGSVIGSGQGPTSIVNGTRVRFLWEAMAAEGLVTDIPTTSAMTYDVSLQDAIMTVQRRAGLTVDGRVGDRTWAEVNRLRGTAHPLTMDDYIEPTAATARGGGSDARIQAMATYFDQHSDATPYTWGGMGYGTERWAGYDCSGLVYQMLAAGGILLECTDPLRHAQRGFRSTQAIYADARLRSVPLRELRDGDIVTFASTPALRHGEICHNGMYIDGHLLEIYRPGARRTRWAGQNIRRDGYVRYVMPHLKRPFA